MAKIGDYFNYDPIPEVGTIPDKSILTYSSKTGSTGEHGNGYGEQTFSASNYKNAKGKWRILNIEGETITLISDPIYQNSGGVMGTTGLYLSNGIGYIWAEEELHRICSIYGYGYGADTTQTVTYYYGGPNDQDSDATGEFALSGVEAQQGRKTTLSLDTPSGARALTVEDVNKICGSDKTYTASYSEGIHTKNSSNAAYYPTLENAEDASLGVSALQTEPSGIYYNTYYTYIISSANSDTTVQTKQNEMLNIGVNYWLGSHCVSPSNISAGLYVRSMTSDGSV